MPNADDNMQLESSGQQPRAGTDSGISPSFGMAPDEDRSKARMPMAVWIAVGAAVLIVAALLAISAIRNPAQGSPADATTQAPLDAYAGYLPISQIVMSEAGSLAGGKLTYIDGEIRNIGQKTVDAITVQTVFRNDVGELPQVETSPLRLIRTRVPYVDLQSVASAPMKPGDHREFRLIFERVTPNWNQQYPEIHVIRVDSK